MKTRSPLLAVLIIVLCGVGLAAANDGSLAALGGGGPMPGVVFLELSDLNQITAEAGYPALREVVLLMGGGGYAGATYGVRVGGLGFGGSTEASAGDRSVTLSVDYGGLLIEKGVRADGDLTVVLGSLLGGGSLDLRLVKNLPGSFSDAVTSPYVSTLSRDFFAVQPYVAFEVRPLSWAWARLQFGLLWTLAEPWTFESAEFFGPPRSFGGFTAQIMIRFGVPDWMTKGTSAAAEGAPSSVVAPQQEQTPSETVAP
jgi:hypothetical protein